MKIWSVITLGLILIGQFTGCGSNGPSDTEAQVTSAPDPKVEFFNETKGEVTQRLESISVWLDDHEDVFAKSVGETPSLERDASFVVAAGSVESFIWWLKREGHGIIPLEHVDSVGNDHFFSGEKIENFHLATGSYSLKRTDIGVLQSKQSSLEDVKRMHAGLMGTHVILTRKVLLEEVVVDEAEGDNNYEFTGGPMRCEVVVLELDSMNPIYSTSFDVEAPDEMTFTTAGGKKLDTAKDRVLYAFHRAANAQLTTRIQEMFK